jgi:hypothetical protein
MSHHSEGFAGVTVDDDGDIPVTPAEAGLVDEKDPAQATATIRCHPIRPRPGQTHDEMPGQLVTTGHLPDRHDVHIPDQLACQTAGDLRSAADDDLGVVLPVPFGAIPAEEPPADPLQGGGPTSRGQITDHQTTLVMNPGRLEPTVRAADHPPDIHDLHHETFDQVHQHSHHTDTPQMQADSHSIGLHQGPFLAR